MPRRPLLPEDPEALGRYRLIERIGRPSGMATVYLGVGVDDGRKVAIKFIHPDLAATDEFRRRFSREAVYPSRVRPAFIAPVLDDGLHDGRPFLVTEYIEGPTLAEHVEEHGPMPAFELERLGYQVASALAAIHAGGLVHRDLKPSNVVLGRTGPRVIDFGIARALDDSGGITLPGLLGTPPYMAPEQFEEHAQVTAAADVFAWGGLMVFASTGRPPFGTAANHAELMLLGDRVANAPAKLDALEEPLRGLVQEAMAKDPSTRPTARDLVLRLGSGDHPAPGDPPTTERHPATAPTVQALRPPLTRPDRTTPQFRLTGPQPQGVPADPPAALFQLPTRPLPAILLTVAALVFLGWLALPGAARLLLALGLAGTAGLAVAGLVMAQSAGSRSRWLWLAGVIVAFAFFMASSYSQLTSQVWVGVADGRVAILQGAGPDGYMGVRNISRVERSAAIRQQLPPTLKGALDQGLSVPDWTQGRLLARCLPQLFTPAVDARVGVQDDSDLCRERLFRTPPLLPAPLHRTLGTTGHSPALAAGDGRVLLAWTASDGRVQLRSSANGTDFELRPDALAAVVTTDEPALATDGSRFFIAWRMTDGRLALASSADGGATFGDPVTLQQTSVTAPALAYGDGRLLLAWVGDNNRLHLLASAADEPLTFPPDQEVLLDETSRVAPSLLFANDSWYLSWAGTDDQVNLQVQSGDLTILNKSTLSGPETSYRPALAFQDVWIMSWTRPDGLVGLFVSKSGRPDFVNQLALNAASGTGLSLASFNGRVLLAWAGDAQQPGVHVVALP